MLDFIYFYLIHLKCMYEISNSKHQSTITWRTQCSGSSASSVSSLTQLGCWERTRTQ